MAVSTLDPQVVTVKTVEDAVKNANVQARLKEKHWELAAPCTDWNYWHIELGDGNILPVTPSLLVKMYERDH